MHTRGRLGLIVAVALAAPLATAHAQDADGTERFGWNPFGGVHGYSETSKLGAGKSSAISSAIVVGLRVWQRLGALTRVEAELPLGVTTSSDQVATLFVTMPRVQGRLLFLQDSRFSPSLVIGAGAPIVTSSKQSSVASDIQYGGYAGGGVKIKLSGLNLGLEARYLAMPAAGDPLIAHEWELLVSFGFRKTDKEAAARPLSDRDGDGVNDVDDQCPDSKEDLDGFEDEDGCPELDNDQDGVIDGLDECPHEAETINGYKDDDGCPDSLVEEVRLVEGVISGLRFESGDGVMDADGYDELNSLAALLKAVPSVKFNLYGHTDDRERPAGKLEALGQARADSVRSYLIEQGVGHGRLRSFSRADTEPIADNDTLGGRRVNRRVEVQLLKVGE